MKIINFKDTDYWNQLIERFDPLRQQKEKVKRAAWLIFTTIGLLATSAMLTAVFVYKSLPAASIFLLTAIGSLWIVKLSGRCGNNPNDRKKTDKEPLENNPEEILKETLESNSKEKELVTEGIHYHVNMVIEGKNTYYEFRKSHLTEELRSLPNDVKDKLKAFFLSDLNTALRYLSYFVFEQHLKDYEADIDLLGVLPMEINHLIILNSQKYRHEVLLSI